MKLALLAGDLSASGAYRCIFPAEQLTSHGHEVKLWPHTIRETEGRIIKEVVEYDLNCPPQGIQGVVLHQRLEDTWMRLKLRKDRPLAVVYDTDDWLLGIPTYNPAFKGTHPKAGVANRYNLPRIVARADLLTVSTPFLAERLSAINRNVRILRNRLNWKMWENARVSPYVEGRVRVGYMGAFTWREGDLDVLRDLVPRLLRRNPHVDFVASGEPDATHDYLGVPEDRRVSYDGLSFHREHMRLHEIVAVMDVGLVPLADHPFNEAKSHLKGMEYNACGIPYVASNTESYRHYTQPGVNGFVARNPQKWMNRVEELVNDHALRKEMGAQARRIAGQHTVQEHWREWEDAWKSVL